MLCLIANVQFSDSGAPVRSILVLMNNLSSALIATAVIIWRCCDADDSFFHLSLMQTTANKAISIVSITSESQAPTPLCLPLPLPQPRSVDQLAHLVCRQAGFPTFTSSALLPRNILHREADQGFNLTCNLKEGLSLHCTANRTNSTCSSIIQVDCGACSFHKIVKSNSTLKISSPLYPVLLPGLSCFWQLEVGDGTKVVLEDLSLSHCSSSYLSFNSRGTLLAHLCGEKAGFQFTVRGRQLQILLESGGGNSGRGFLATITAPPIILRRRSTSMMAGGVVMVAFALAIFLTAFVLLRRGQARRRRACRHASTWRGPAPAGGGRTTAQIARASTLNQLPPPSYSFAIRQLPAAEVNIVKNHS